MEQTALLMAHMEDLARRAQKAGSAFSEFLSPAQRAEVSRAFTRRSDVKLAFEGGFQNAERRVAVFLNPDWGSFGPPEAVAALALRYRPQDSLGHRDILGALMALGVRRSVIGDIQAGNPAYLACTPAMADYLAQNLTQAGRVGLSARPADLGSLPASTPALDTARDTVASLRLDALLAAAFNLSRGEAAQAIRAGLVELDHQVCLQGDRPLKPGDTFSLRGQGKAALLEAGGLSRKGRLWVTLGRYI